MPRVRFEILPPIDRPHEPVHLTFDDSSVAPLVLCWEPPFQVGEVQVPEGAVLNYRIQRVSGSTAEVDAFGRHPELHSHEVWMDAVLDHVVADWEDRISGRLERVTIASKHLHAQRDVIVWLPPGYFKNEDSQYPLIVGFDGERFFDPTTSPSGVDWALDEWVGLLSRRGVMPECIVVGIVAPAGLGEDDVPLRDVELSEERHGEDFSRFVAGELVPFLDQHYRTIPKCGSRTVIGAGLGGLRAFWTALRHPDVFSRAACLSTSFEDISQSVPASSRSLISLEEFAFHPEKVRLYFDHGDSGLDECYEIYHMILGGLLRDKGWGGNLKISTVPGGRHDDSSWRCRVGEALRWLAY